MVELLLWEKGDRIKGVDALSGGRKTKATKMNDEGFSVHSERGFTIESVVSSSDKSHRRFSNPTMRGSLWKKSKKRRCTLSRET